MKLEPIDLTTFPGIHQKKTTNTPIFFGRRLTGVLSKIISTTTSGMCGALTLTQYGGSCIPVSGASDKKDKRARDCFKIIGGRSTFFDLKFVRDR